MLFYGKNKITFTCYFTMRNTIAHLCILCLTIKSTGTWKIVYTYTQAIFSFGEGHSLRVCAEVSDGWLAGSCHVNFLLLRISSFVK